MAPTFVGGVAGGFVSVRVTPVLSGATGAGVLAVLIGVPGLVVVRLAPVLVGGVAAVVVVVVVTAVVVVVRVGPTLFGAVGVVVAAGAVVPTATPVTATGVAALVAAGVVVVVVCCVVVVVVWFTGWWWLVPPTPGDDGSSTGPPVVTVQPTPKAALTAIAAIQEAFISLVLLRRGRFVGNSRDGPDGAWTTVLHEPFKRGARAGAHNKEKTEASATTTRAGRRPRNA